MEGHIKQYMSITNQTQWDKSKEKRTENGVGMEGALELGNEGGGE